MPKAPSKGGPYLGIDPGQSGGISFVYNNLDPLVYQMPDTDLHLYGVLSGHVAGTVAIIEKVTSSPQMGVASAFTFGCGYGKLLMALTAAGIPFEEVRPQVWQAALAIPPRKYKTEMVRKVVKRVAKMKKVKVWLESESEFKLRLLRKAQQLFPSLLIWSEPKSKGRQLAIADSLLIAEFCRRKHGGLL